MKGYKLRHAEKYVETKNKKYLLSVVALILTVCMLISVTYSWIDNISTISVVAPKPDNKTTLKIDSETDSVIDITTGDEIIDIGSYFSNSGNMTLTACSGDGRDFYFKKSLSDGSTTSYRRGTANDVNVNYISCTFKVNSTNDGTVFWLNELPVLKDGETDLSSYLRCAVTVDDETIVLANSGNYNCVRNIAGETKSCTAKAPSSYMWESNLEEGHGSNDYLFFMEKGETKIVTVKMWLEDPDSKLSINTHNLTLSMSMIATLNRQTIYLNDHTFDATGINLLSALSEGESLDNIFYMCLADDVDTYWTFSSVSGTNGIYKAEIPIIHRNKNVYIMRCNGSYGKGSTLLSGTLHYNNKWNAVLPQTAEDATYTVLGEATNGAWVESVKINCDDQYGLATDTTKMTLGDLNTDKGRIMYYDDVHGYWSGYALATSDRLKFTADLSTDIEWGYCSNTSKQTRPTVSGQTEYIYTIYDVDDGDWYTGDDYSEEVSSYVIKGDFNNWKGTPMLYSDKANHLSYAYIQLESGTYDFKIYSNNSYKWYSDGGEYKFGTSSNSAEQTLTLAENKDNSKLVVEALTKSNFLFVYNNDTDKLTITFSPMQPADNDASVYVAVKNDLNGGNWLTHINHWGETNAVTSTTRNVTKVGSYNITNYPATNCYEVAEGAWSNGSGNWVYKTAAHDNDKLFLKPNSNWKADNARFAAYFFGNGEKWVNMEDVGDGYYYVTIPTGATYTEVIFCRMNPDTTDNNFNNGVRWNQTNDLTLPANSSSTSTGYDLYYVNLDKDATNMQWCDDSQGIPNQSPGATNNGYYFNHNPLNGTMYYITVDNATFGCSKLSTNRQTPPTLNVNGGTSEITASVGDVIKFSTSTTPTSGTAYKQANSATYYVRKVRADGTTGSDKVVNSSWTPNRKGTYEVRARFNDGYITSDINNVITITVN